jgi:hypothetical protein
MMTVEMSVINQRHLDFSVILQKKLAIKNVEFNLKLILSQLLQLFCLEIIDFFLNCNLYNLNVQ